MEMVDLATILTTLDRYGWPCLILLGIAWCGRRFAQWAAPKLDAMIDGHTKFVQTITEESPRQTAAIKEIQEASKVVAESLLVIRPQVHEIHTRVHQREA